MAYTIPIIKDRVASGDDLFYIEDQPDGKKKLVPAPESVTENGTPINRALLRDMANAIVGVVESGANANGNFIKFADGTLICYIDKITSYQTWHGTAKWIFPYTPINKNYHISFTNLGDESGGVNGRTYQMKQYIYDKKINEVTVATYFNSGGTPNQHYTIIMVGRWQ